MHGRELAGEIFDLLGTSSDWRGLSLVPRDTLFGFAMILPAAAAFLASITLDRSGRRQVVWAMIIVVMISLLVGLIQFGSNGSALDIYNSRHRGSFLGFFANRNHQGLLMAIGGVFAVAAIKERFDSHRLTIALAALAAIVFFTAAVGTLSRAGIGLTMLGLCITLFAIFKHDKLKWPYVAAGGFAAALALYFVTFSSTTQTALDRFSQIEENGRLEIWQKSSPLIEQYLPWGAGLGSYTSVYPVIERLQDVNPLYFNRIHNDYLEVLIEFGVPGLILLLLFAALYLRRILEGLRSSVDIGVFALPAAVSIGLVALHSIVDYPLRTQSHAVLFAMSCGFLFSLHRKRPSSNKSFSQSPVWSDRTVRLKAIGLTGGALAITALVFLVFYQKEGPDVVERSGVNQFVSEGEAMSTAQLSAAMRALNRQPLDQSLLNAIFASEVKRGLDDTRRRAYISTLSKMGWRNTPTQQNLLYEAAQRNDLEAALNHIDALLRRDKLVEQIMPLLTQIEVDPAGTRIMVDWLAQDPIWRERYFRFAEPLADPEVLDARLRLLRYMSDQNISVSRVERQATFYALFAAGRRKAIADLARSELPTERKSQLLFDPGFDQWLGEPSETRWATAPQDWRLTNKSGLSTQIISEEWGSRLVLRWSGRGAPTIARTMTFLIKGQRPELEVALSAGSQLRGLESLRFTLACPGEREVLFVRKMAGSVGSPGMDRRSAYYQAEAGAPCDYPELLIGGSPQSGDRRSDLSIDSIKLTLP
ncbi:O-antigen ligase family protein [Altererythrobacter ishigakiensis]|uniref:O-antigen ligase family protein n=1 Tax=Altererythrobacter ishigakiensis TaxID=476157 RepID=UPI001B86B4DF|nr:O-antigen ligase family protein [Altererythrobacter ishigakiensis]